MKYTDIREIANKHGKQLVYDGINRSDVDPFLDEHHTALCRGYVRVNQMVVRPYNGRFGKGFCVLTHNSSSTRYCFITYCTDKECPTL